MLLEVSLLEMSGGTFTIREDYHQVIGWSHPVRK
jgi:hypothetical protein